MSLMFWRSREKTGDDVRHGPAKEVSEDNALPTSIYFKRSGSADAEAVSDGYPLPAEVVGSVTVKGTTYSTGPLQITGIGAAAAYTAAEAFGGKMVIPVPKSGTIITAIFFDHDDEGLSKEMVMFQKDFTATADNSAFAVSDGDLENCVGALDFTYFRNFGNNQLAEADNVPHQYVAPDGVLYCQFVTRGADNIAALNEPAVMLLIQPDA